MVPLRPTELEALRRLHRILKAEGWDFTMIGAAVQTIVSTPVLQPRFTGDLDGVITTPTWSDYERVGTILQHHGFTRHGVHRFTFEDAHVDLIPFAESLVAEGQRLEWPGGGVFRVLGFAEALATATPLAVAPDLEVKVVSVPGLVVLKLNSYLDSPQERRRDIADIADQCEAYHASDDARYGVQTEARTTVTFEDAGAYLLGRDVAHVADSVCARLAEEFSARATAGRLAPDVVHERGLRSTDERLAALEALFTAFETGLDDGRAVKKHG